MVAVRGAEVYELADEEGNLLNDPATQKERVSPGLTLTLTLTLVYPPSPPTALGK